LSAGALDGAFFNVDGELVEIRDDLFERSFGNETEVAGAGGGVMGARAELVAAVMEVDADFAECEGLATVEGDDFHIENLRVKVSGDVETGYGEHEMVERGDGKGHAGIMDLRRESWLVGGQAVGHSGAISGADGNTGCDREQYQGKAESTVSAVSLRCQDRKREMWSTRVFVGCG
jgi:hypothetical protein